MTTLRLYFQLGWPDHEATLPWTVLDNNGKTTAQGNSSPQGWPRADQVELVLPAGRTLFTQVRLPAGTRQPTHNMLAFALEEKLVNDPQANLYALGDGPDQEGWCTVAVTEALPVRRAVAMLKSLGKLVDHILPEELSLPLPADEAWSVAQNHAHWLIRRGRLAVSVVPILPDNAERGLLQQLWRLKPPTRLTACGQAAATAFSTLGIASDCTITLSDDDWRASQIIPAFDFAQGELAPNRRWSQWRPSLRRTGQLLLLLLGAHLLVMVCDAAWWSWRKAVLSSTAAQLSQAISGNHSGQATLLAMRAVDRQRLAHGLPARESALALMAALSEVMEVDSSVESVGFDSARLTVKLRDVPMDQLTHWKNRLASQGVRLQVRALAGNEKELIVDKEP